MQRGKTKRCQVPIRTRRRQSDAKWRASVASCYETLKFIIPNGKALPKRKASKSLILQETEKHISGLERALSRLLNIEAQEQGQGVLWKKGDNWAPATLNDFQNDFAEQQQNIFHQASQGRRCYNMLHDIQEEIINLSVDCSNVAFVPLSGNDDINKNTRDVATCTRRHRVSKTRCRYETERATQKILAAYNNGDIVDAVIPSSSASHTSTSADDGDHQLQAVPTTPLSTHNVIPTTARSPSTPSVIPTTSRSLSTHGIPTVSRSFSTHSVIPSTSRSLANPTGKTVRLQKCGDVFVCGGQMYTGEFPSLSGLDRMVVKQAQENDQLQGMHEVPMLASPGKVYGIARHDVMMSQEGELRDVFCSTAQALPVPTTIASTFIKQEMDSDANLPYFSSVCKKLDFSDSTAERLFEHDRGSLNMMDSTPYFSSVASLAETGYTPLKSQVTYTTGFTPLKSEMVTLTSGGQTLTPMKMSTDLCMTDTALFSPNSAWALGSAMDARVPQAGLSDLEELGDMDEDRSLLCMETFKFNLDNPVTDPSLLTKTPQKLSSPGKPRHVCKKRSACKKKCHSSRHGDCGHKPRPKCRKRLEGLYEKSSSEKAEEKDREPILAGIFEGNAECTDFDGYLLYYQQVAPALKHKLGSAHDENSLAALVSDMWSQLPSDDRSTMVTLAALENQDSRSSGSGSLSQDLEDLNVTPIADRELGC